MKLLFSALFLFFNLICFADGSISGNAEVTSGATENYTVTWDKWGQAYEDFTNVSWSVVGGTVLYFDKHSATIKWDNSAGYGSVDVSEDMGGQSGNMSVERILEVCQQANAGPDVNACPGSPSIIGTAAISGYSYDWFPKTGLSNSTVAQPSASPAQSTTYTVVMTPQNLIVNGDFELGQTGYNTDYGIIPNGTGCCCGYGSLAVSSNPKTLRNAWCDRTAMFGNKMLIVDGHCRSNERVWFQTVTVSPNTSYNFSGWASSNTWVNPTDWDSWQRTPQLRVRINGVDIIQNFVVNDNTCSGWHQFSAVWNSGTSSTASIEIYDDITGGADNDFNLDNLYLGNCAVTSDQVNVNVSGFPVISPSGTTTICSNWEDISNPAILTSNVSGNLQWYRDGQPISGATSQTYYAYADNGQGNIIKTYSYTVNNNGCQSDPVTVNFVPYPFAFATDPCRGSTINFYATDYGPGSSYYWNIPGGIITPNQSSRQIQVTFPSSYTQNTFDVYLTVSSLYSCNGSVHQTFSFMSGCRVVTDKKKKEGKDTSGDFMNQPKVTTIMRPNIFTINSSIPISRVEIYSSTGALVKKIAGSQTTTMNLNTSTLAAGVYFCKVFNNRREEIHKFIVRR